MTNATCELVGLKGLLQDLHVHHFSPMLLYCDNQAALFIANNPIFYERTKHIEIYYHFIRKKVTSGILRTSYVPSQYQLADIFTKALGKDRFEFLLRKLGITNLHAPT